MFFRCGAHVYNHYLDCRDTDYYVCEDSISDVLALPGEKVKHLTPVLACHDRSIRVLRDSTLMYNVELPGILKHQKSKEFSAKIQIGTLCRSPFVSGAFLQWWRWKWRRSTLRNRRWQNWAFTAYQVCSNAVKKGPPRKELKKSSCWKKTRKFLCMTVNEKVAL